MKIDSVLLGAMRKYGLEFRDFSRQVKRDCKDADRSRNEAIGVIYRTFLNKDDSLPTYLNFERLGNILDDMRAGKVNKLFGCATASREIGAATITTLRHKICSSLRNEFFSDETREGEDLLYNTIRSKAESNRRYMKDPIAFVQREALERKEFEETLKCEPWYIRIPLKPLFNHLQRPFKL